MRLLFWLLRLLPMWEYICPKCRKTVKKSSHECPHCGERFPLALRVPPSFLKDPKKLEEYVHKHVFPRVSAFERNYLTQYFTTLFAHGFEGGNFGNDPETGYAWNSTRTYQGGAVAVVSDWAHHGTYSQKTALAAQDWSEGWARKELSVTGELYVRWYFKTTALPSTNNYKVSLSSFVSEDLDTFLAYVIIKNVGGTSYWGGSVEGSDTISSSTVAANTEYCVELHYKKSSGASNGQLHVYVNDVAVVSVTNHNNTKNIGCLDNGARHLASGSWVASYYFDCVVIADAYIGPEEEGPTLVEVADSLELAETVLRNKTLILSDALGLMDSLYGNKFLLLSDSASLSDLVTVIISEVMKYVTDAVNSADVVSTPFRVLRALEAIGVADNAIVNKVLQITETVSLAEILEVGVGGVKKTRLFLIIGDLAVQLTGD